MEEYELLIGGGIAVTVVLLLGLWLHIKLKPKSTAKEKSAAKGMKKGKAKKADKFFQDKGKALDEKGNVLEDSNL